MNQQELEEATAEALAAGLLPEWFTKANFDAWWEGKEDSCGPSNRLASCPLARFARHYGMPRAEVGLAVIHPSGADGKQTIRLPAWARRLVYDFDSRRWVTLTKKGAA